MPETTLDATDQIHGSLTELGKIIASIEKRESEAGNDCRRSPNYRALFDREASLRSAVRSIERNAGNSEERNFMSIEKIQNDYRESLAAMRSIWDATGGKLGNRFQDYSDAEARLEAAAGRLTTLRGESCGPRLTPDMSREERLEAWENSRRSAGAGLQAQEDTRHAPGPYGYDGGADRPFRSLGEQMQAVIQAGIPGHQADPRLFQTRAATGMNEGVGADGGFVVQSDFTSDIWSRMFDEGRVLGRARRIQITSNSNSIKHPYMKESSRVNGSRRGGLRVYRKAEADSVSSTKPQIGQFSLELQTGMGIVYLTDELMEDAAQLEAFLGVEVPKEIAFTIEDEMFNGNGVGRCLGILNAPCLVTVAKESGQIAGTINSENVVKMFARIPASSVPNSAWYVNQQAWPEIFKLSHVIKNVAGTENVGGSAMFIPSGGIASAPQGTLLGRPIIPVEYCAAVGTLGDIVLGDFSQYALIEKGGVKAASSIHVRFIYGENVLRFTFRNNGAPGYAWADGALTPFKGSDTVSPFIALQTRS